MLNVVTVQNLKKSYSKKLAIDNLSFEIPKNKITAILGPNGAGKSSTINILSTILKKDSGKIVFFDNLDIDKKSDLKNIKRNLGIVPQDLALYEDVPAQKNVEFFASLYGIKGADLVRSVEWALKFVGSSNIKIGGLCAIAQAILRRRNDCDLYNALHGRSRGNR